LEINIRQAHENDYETVTELTREAFWNLYRPGCDEHYLVHRMRSHDDYLPELEYVAEMDHEIVGSIIYTKSHVINELGEKTQTATFGPLCVHPRYQRRGIGTALIEFTKKLVIEKKYPAIIILGDPHNYCKHGFRAGKDHHVSTLDGKYPLGLLVLELERGFFDTHRWKFKESSVYEIESDEVDDFDKGFPPKEKKYQYSQALFSMLVRSFVE
jgi:predicted N-acetyltransferase YhbS